MELAFTCITRARDLLTSLFTVLTLIDCVMQMLWESLLWNYKYVDFFCISFDGEFCVYDTVLHSYEDKHMARPVM